MHNYNDPTATGTVRRTGGAKKTRNFIIVLLAIAAVVVVAVIISSHSKRETINVSVAPIKPMRFEIKLPESGVVQHPHTEAVPALVAGNLSGLFVHPGQFVTKGQLLATVYNAQIASNAVGSLPTYQAAVAGLQQAQQFQRNGLVATSAQVATALSTLNEAHRTYVADLDLYNNKAIPKDTLDQQKAKLDQAQVAYNQAVEQRRLNAINVGGQSSAAVEKAQMDKARNDRAYAVTQYNQTRIVAPFDGQIQTIAAQTNDALRTIEIGDAVTQGQSIFTIAEGNRYIVQAQVDEQDIAQVRIGQNAVVSGQDFNGANFPGHVAAIAPTAQKSTDANSTTKQVLTTIQLDSDSPLLKDGLTADVDIITTDIPNAITVPTTSITTIDGKKYVWKVSSDSKLHKAAIVSGQSNDTVTVITSGVSAGDRVVTTPLSTFVDGMPVTVVPAAGSSQIPGMTSGPDAKLVGGGGNN